MMCDDGIYYGFSDEFIDGYKTSLNHLKVYLKEMYKKTDNRKDFYDWILRKIDEMIDSVNELLDDESFLS